MPIIKALISPSSSVPRLPPHGSPSLLIGSPHVAALLQQKAIPSLFAGSP